MVICRLGKTATYALNARTGAKLWSYKTRGNEVSSSLPAVANGVVYVGSDDGNVYALNAITGAKLWSYRSPRELCVVSLARRGEWGAVMLARTMTTCTR